MGRERSQGENGIKFFSHKGASFGDCRPLIPPDRRSDRSRASPAVARLIRQKGRDCNCRRVNSAEAETTRPTHKSTALALFPPHPRPEDYIKSLIISNKL